jgi:UDP-glucose 4-epimerase
VTGGAGFPDSHLCDRLLETGTHVICVDNFFTDAHLDVSHLHEHPYFELIRQH